MDRNNFNTDIWTVIERFTKTNALFMAEEMTQVMNLLNGCLVNHTITSIHLQSGKYESTESLQFIPDINIELDGDNKVVQKLSKYTNMLRTPLEEKI